jgi:hypothetical protein
MSVEPDDLGHDDCTVCEAARAGARLATEEIESYPPIMVYRSDLARLRDFASRHRLGDSVCAFRALLDLAERVDAPSPEPEAVKLRIRDAMNSARPGDRDDLLRRILAAIPTPPAVT